MNRDSHSETFPFADFERAKEALLAALTAERDAFLLLTGDTGVGKSTLLQDLRVTLDRCRYRLLYLPGGQKLGPSGFVRILAKTLRVKPCRSHAETAHAVSRQLLDDPQRLLVWLDDAHDVPDDTLTEMRSLAESSLGSSHLLQVVLAGWPLLRERLQGMPALSRRIVVREEITGLTRDELPPFLAHHFGDHAEKVDDEGIALLFEHGRGIPGLIVSLFRTLLASKPQVGSFEAQHVEELLQRFDII